jgi:hypothetical protein
MDSHKQRTALVWDNGLFVEMAVTLAKDFGRVIYFAPWVSGYPRSNAKRTGEGLPGVERVSSPWPYYDEVDLWVFPDVYDGPVQEFLVKQGKRVWGARMGEELELDRDGSKQHSRKLGIDIGNYTVIEGLDALREYLKRNEDQWVKISTTRGDMETFHAPTYEAAEQRLDELEHNLGAKKKIMEFIVEDGINPAIEAGYDGYTVDGTFAKGAIVGVEVKDEAYLGRAIRYADMPKGVLSVNKKLSPALKDYQYRGWISTEVRCTPDGKSYLIDPCARMGSPPGELYPAMIGNWADIIWEGAGGVLIEPEFKAKWGAEILLDSDWADSNWQQVNFPKSVRENVKLRNLTVIDGEYYVIPQWTGCPQIGAVVATGESADEAIAECRRIGELVTGYSIDKPHAALDKAREELAKILGDKMDDKPLSAMERKANDLRRAGKISDKQYEKMIERT